MKQTQKLDRDGSHWQFKSSIIMLLMLLAIMSHIRADLSTFSQFTELWCLSGEEISHMSGSLKTNSFIIPLPSILLELLSCLKHRRKTLSKDFNMPLDQALSLGEFFLI
jgi:hypothetical protein